MTAMPLPEAPRRYGTPRRRAKVRVPVDWSTLDLGTPTQTEARAALHRAFRAFDGDPSDEHLAEVARLLTEWRQAR